MPASSSPSYQAAEDIEPARFVRVTGDRQVSKCEAGDQAIGVSMEGSRTAPIPGATVLAAAEGEPIHVYGMAEPCEVEAGGTIAAGDFIKPDADAKAVVASEGEPYSAIAQRAAVSGEKCLVQVGPGVTPPIQNT